MEESFDWVIIDTGNRGTAMDVAQMIIEEIAHVRNTFNQGRTKPLAWRMNQLNALGKLMRDNEDSLYEAVKAD